MLKFEAVDPRNGPSFGPSMVGRRASRRDCKFRIAFFDFECCGPLRDDLRALLRFGIFMLERKNPQMEIRHQATS